MRISEKPYFRREVPEMRLPTATATFYGHNGHNALIVRKRPLPDIGNAIADGNAG
jgi:hypothetical protein